MHTGEFILKTTRLVAEGKVGPGWVHVHGESIARVGDGSPSPQGDARIVDLGDGVLMAGLVDTHVHINAPGRTHWEGFETATAAAAAGGVTTLVEMPLNSIPATTSAEALEIKIAEATGKCRVDVGFWGGLVPGNAADLSALFEAGAWGFKCFMSPSGVDEFSHVSLEDIEEALPILAALKAPLLVHAEWPPALEPWPGGDPRRHAAWLACRPPEAEQQAVAHLIALAERFGAHIHVVHVADQGTVALLRQARARGVALTAETCPHYLTFCAEEIPDGATAFKCAPPIRQRFHREALWDALQAGDLDLIATDHSPSPPELKCLATGDFSEAWGGIASLQLLLPAVWTQARARAVTLPTLSRWLSAAPAALAGLDGRKGRLAPGMDADLVVWDPEASFTVDPAALAHRHATTPYAGLRLDGVVRATWVRGACVFDRDPHNPLDGAPPAGQHLACGAVLRRGRA